MANSLDYSNIGLTSFVEARDPTASETNAQLDQIFCNSSTGDHFVCIDDTPAAQQWQRTSDGVVFPPAILATDHPNLIAMYTMDNISGSTLVDESPNGNNGTITGATQETGYIGNALQLGTTSKYVGLPDFTSGDTQGAFCFWYKYASADSGVINRMVQFTRRTGTGLTSAITILKLTDNTIRCNVNDTVTDTTQVTSALSPDTWYFIVYQQDGIADKLYLNAVEDSTGTSTSKWFANLPNDTRHYNLGRFYDGISPAEEGTNYVFDQWRYFNRALTQDEITALANEV